MEVLEALCLFFKVPEIGKVKTRLAKEIGKEEAFNIYQYLLKNSIKIAEALTAFRDVKLFGFYRGNNLSHFKKLFNFIMGWRFLPQEGKTLGESLKRAGECLLNIGFKKVVFIGADCPFISVDYLLESFQRLEKYSVVIGPSHDGGYVLLGFSDTFKDRIFILFDDLPFETSKLFDETLKRLSSNDFYLLPNLFDIDTLEDWQKYLKISKVT